MKPCRSVPYLATNTQRLRRNPNELAQARVMAFVLIPASDSPVAAAEFNVGLREENNEPRTLA
jgi:hypothetical protein